MTTALTRWADSGSGTFSTLRGLHHGASGGGASCLTEGGSYLEKA